MTHWTNFYVSLTTLFSTFPERWDNYIKSEDTIKGDRAFCELPFKTVIS